MEKRIKTLYIVTIIAILTFLGMQVYWLYGRYEYSLQEYENDTYKALGDALEEYIVNHCDTIIAEKRLSTIES